MQYASFNRFEIAMTREQAHGTYHQGQCEDDAAALAIALQDQLDAIGPDKIRAELAEYGAWDAGELSDDDLNRQRIVWLAAGDIYDPHGNR